LGVGTGDWPRHAWAASANGVISSKGGTNFSGKEWWGFDIRTAVEDFFKLPVVYNNDAKAVRGYAEKGDEMALRIFEQQAKAIGRMFSIAANFTDPDAYFVGGGIVEAETHFRDWCMDIVRASTDLRDEQRQIVQFAVVPDLDMAGARGSALAALQMLRIAAA
jgi:predicted NBD/HSP70 family sugar kinase